MSGEIALTERFVVRADTAPTIARAFVADRLRARRLWLAFGIVEVLMAAVLVAGFDPELGLGLRIFWALAYALVPTSALLGLMLLSMRVTTERNIRKRLPAGAVMESGFGADAFVVRGPLSESRITYASITSVTRRGGVVFLRQVGVPLLNAFPGELFPEAEIDRLSASAH
jgi:hypothetical protein